MGARERHKVLRMVNGGKGIIRELDGNGVVKATWSSLEGKPAALDGFYNKEGTLEFIGFEDQVSVDLARRP